MDQREWGRLRETVVCRTRATGASREDAEDAAHDALVAAMGTPQHVAPSEDTGSPERAEIDGSGQPEPGTDGDGSPPPGDAPTGRSAPASECPGVLELGCAVGGLVEGADGAAEGAAEGLPPAVALGRGR